MAAVSSFVEASWEARRIRTFSVLCEATSAAVSEGMVD